MKTSTKAHISTKNHWLVAIALWVPILLLGTTWYSTTELASMPDRTQRDGPHLRGTLSDSFEPNLLFAESRADASHGRRSTGSGRDLRGVKRGKPKSPAMSTGSFAPFLDIVPSQDGHELYISASGVGIPEGEIFVHIGIGPGHREGSYTMTYSETVQAHVATAIGFEAGEGASGPINITTTLGLDTGSVDFYRPYIPASTPQTMSSIDGNLELSWVNTDTITFDTYIAVVPSYAPPGPAPQGHRLVGSTYSVRAAAALPETNRPMLLRLYYDDATLAGADPHTLAIFAWDAFRKSWVDLGGRLFYDRQYVSVTTHRFTTYALMATPAWQDDFDDLSGLDLIETNNVTLGLQGGAPELLVLWSTPGSGTAVSKPITPTTAIANWSTLAFTSTADPPTTTLTVDVLSVDGAELLTDVTSGASLVGIDPVQYPSLKLRANLSSAVAGETPALDEWRLTWQVEVHKVYLPVVLRSWR
jgi:hypothetical protein